MAIHVCDIVVTFVGKFVTVCDIGENTCDISIYVCDMAIHVCNIVVTFVGIFVTVCDIGVHVFNKSIHVYDIFATFVGIL